MESLKRFVENELSPSFQVALLLLQGDLRQLVPFTQERQVVTAALENVYTELKPRARLAPGTLMQQLLVKIEACELPPPALVDVQCLRDSAYEYASEVTQRANNFVQALEGIVGHVEGLDGHKSVLIVGGSVSLNPAKEASEALRALYGNLDEISDFEQSLRSEEAVRPRLDDLFARAFRNHVSISFIDRTPAPSDVSARFGRQFTPGMRPMSTAFQSAQQDLNEIAAATGGSFVASTRVDEGLRQSMALMESVYDLSISLPDNEPLTPRRLRRMSIQTTRPGVRIIHRRGFEGGRNTDDAPAANLRGTIEAGAFERQDIDGTSVDVVPLRFILDPADLGYEEREHVAAAQFAVTLRLRTSDGVLLTDTHRVLTHTYPLELWRSRDIEPPALVAFADVPPGDYVAEAVVTVPRLGQRGILRSEFTAAAAVAEDTGPSETAAIATVPVQRAVPQQKAARPAEDREYRPSIAFARHFLGVVTGSVGVSVLVGRDVASVELLLDGQRVGVADSEPWTLPLSLGAVPSPREPVAVARDRRGREISRVRQWLNLPRPWTELEVVLSDAPGEGLIGRVALESVGREKPLQVTAILDGAPAAVSNSPTFKLPGVDMTNIHLLRVEAQFEKAGIVSRDVVFGGRYVQEASAELSSVALQLPRSGDVSLNDIEIRAGDKPVPVVALEKGPADLIVVVDPRALRMLPGMFVTGSTGAPRPSLRPGADARITPAEADVHLRLLWPVADGDNTAGQTGYRLFPSTDPDAASPGGLLSHLAGAAFPAEKGPVRLADAVVVAGPMAIERGRRRAVLLVLSGSRSEGDYTAAAVRAYLAQLRVPLIVWSTGSKTRSMLDDWGEVEVVANAPALRNAWRDLMKKLDRQRVAWLEGMHLPQTLEAVRGDVELAGAPRR